MIATGSDLQTLVVLVPGAWMGSWIWEDTTRRLIALGHETTALTLLRLEPGRPLAEIAAVGLKDHVNQVAEVIRSRALQSVVLVGHSYSGTVIGQAADRFPGIVRRSIHVGGFLPRDGRSLIDDWGPDAAARLVERNQISADAMTWAPPPFEALQQQAALTDRQRSWLTDRFVPHPGRTVLDAAQMTRPIEHQPVSYISSTAPDTDPTDDLPPECSHPSPRSGSCEP